MKNKIICLVAIGILCLGTHSFSAQQQTQSSQQELEKEILRTRGPTYDPEQRRDPFRDLLVGQEATETGEKGIRQISIDDVVLVGIAKSKGRLTGIINDAQSFAYYIKKGDTLKDGFVLSISDNRIVFRKTKERGIPLFKPKDIVKEIKLEER
jgi:Tfp pilus assembly protein PilP